MIASHECICAFYLDGIVYGIYKYNIILLPKNEGETYISMERWREKNKTGQ